MANFTTLFQLLILSFSYIRLTQSKILKSSSEISPEYDFVVVGGGVAGDVIANRLTEDPNVTVLVVEAGGPNEGVLNLEVPFLFPNNYGGRFTWNSTTTPQIGLGGRIVTFLRGYVLGGSSSMNGMIHTRGSSEDYDKIAQLTDDQGWSWDSIQPYIRKMERFSRPADNHNTTGQFDPSAHGFDGMTSISLPGFPRAIDEKVIQTTRENPAFPFNLDMNAGNPLGIGWMQATITSSGRRDSAATSYLGSSFIGRPNLHVLLNNQVTRLTSVNNTFRTVEFVQRIDGVTGPNSTVDAKKEIILSAGVIGTPHLLLHSGIGDRDVLSSLGIHTVQHLPSVGQNLTDHPLTFNAWFVNSTDTFERVTQNETLLAEQLDLWQRTGTGFLTTSRANHLGWLRLPSNATIFNTVADPASGPHTPHFELIISNGVPFDPPSTGNFISIGTSVTAPASRGSVTWNSSNPLDQPLIDLNLLGHEFDRVAMREALRSARRFLDSPAWNGYVLDPLGDLASVDLNDDEQVDNYFRANGDSGYHAVGTASMSPKGASWGVTDPDLKVKGVNGLRIVDASVIPHVPSAHIQESVYIIAERAADVIKAAWGNAA